MGVKSQKLQHHIATAAVVVDLACTYDRTSRLGGDYPTSAVEEG